MWNAGKNLWHDHGEAFENHYLYFMSQIIKQYDMKVEEFDYSMKLFAEWLKLIQLPSFKKAKSFAEADWEIQKKQINNYNISRAIFNGLPWAYQKNLRSANEQDWREMDDPTFVAAIVNFDIEDRADQEEKKQQAEQKKAANERDRESGDNKNSKKRGRTNDGDNKFCKYCKKAGNKFFNNHNSKDCTSTRKLRRRSFIKWKSYLWVRRRLLHFSISSSRKKPRKTVTNLIGPPSS